MNGANVLLNPKNIVNITFKINNNLQFLSLFCSEDFVAVSQYINFIIARKILSDNTDNITIPRLRTPELI
jgi:hypothetical protein